jgi:hypothetical protein
MMLEFEVKEGDRIRDFGAPHREQRLGMRSFLDEEEVIRITFAVELEAREVEGDEGIGRRPGFNELGCEMGAGGAEANLFRRGERGCEYGCECTSISLSMEK